METTPPVRAGRVPLPRRDALLGLAAVLVLAMIGSASRAAEPLPAPGGEVLLVVRGAISLPNVGDETHLDRAALERLPRAAFTTETPWLDGAHTFEGARVGALLEAVGAASTRFTAIGLDDYRATLEDIDFERYPVIVADRLDGEPFTVRQLGPLWIMFPFGDHPELRTEANTAFAVWQLVVMDVH